MGPGAASIYVPRSTSRIRTAPKLHDSNAEQMGYRIFRRWLVHAVRDAREERATWGNATYVSCLQDANHQWQNIRNHTHHSGQRPWIKTGPQTKRPTPSHPKASHPITGLHKANTQCLTTRCPLSAPPTKTQTRPSCGLWFVHSSFILSRQ